MWLKHKYDQFLPCPFCGGDVEVSVTFSERFNKEENISQKFIAECGGKKLPDEPAGYCINVHCLGCSISMTEYYECNGIGYPTISNESLIDPLFYNEKINTGSLAFRWNKRATNKHDEQVRAEERKKASSVYLANIKYTMNIKDMAKLISGEVTNNHLENLKAPQ